MIDDVLVIHEFYLGENSTSWTKSCISWGLNRRRLKRTLRWQRITNRKVHSVCAIHDTKRFVHSLWVIHGSKRFVYSLWVIHGTKRFVHSIWVIHDGEKRFPRCRKFPFLRGGGPPNSGRISNDELKVKIRRQIHGQTALGRFTLELNVHRDVSILRAWTDRYRTFHFRIEHP